MKTNIKKVILKDKNSAYITTNSPNEDIVLDDVAKALKNGVKIVQFFNNKLNDKDKILLAQKIHQLCSLYDALFLINQRVDIAKIIDSDGIYLDKSSISPLQALKIISQDKFIATNYIDENSDLIIEVNQNDDNYENKIFRVQIC